MSISVKNLTKQYHSQLALNNVSFDLNKGEVLGFLGPNGAGKSTMMKIITGYISQNHGTVELNGIDINKNPMDARMLIGYLPEENPLYEHMYVREYLCYVAGIYKIKNKMSRLNHMVEITGLGLEQNKKIKQLSKGYKQRVGIAQALIHKPEIVILDEPTTGLDPNQLVYIRDLIKNISSEKTLMMSTHIMQEVEAMCDRVIILDRGEIVSDSNKDLFLKSSDSIIIEFDNNIDINAFNSIDKLLSIEYISINKYKITSSADIRKEIFTLCVLNKYILISMYTVDDSLEYMFNKLTQH